jgi:hypothetical protein
MSSAIARGRRSTLVAVVCALGVTGWAGDVRDAHAASLSIHAVGGQRVSLRLHGGMTSGAHNFLLDGKRLSRTRRRVIMAVPRHAAAGDAIARWRLVEVRRAGSGRLVARARFALAVPRSRNAPTLVLLAAPPSSTARTRAVLRFSVSGGTTSCAHDGASFRRCSSPIAYKSLAAGSHRFRIRAANRHGTTTIETATTVFRRDKAPSAPGPTPPNAEAGRRLVFEDNFDGTRLNTANWIPYNSAGNGGNGLRRDSAIQLDGSGNLVITANSVNGQPVSGGMSTQRSYTYGWFEFRVRTEPDPTGTMSGVVLTWPQSGRWPDDGENDIYETGADLGMRSPFYSYVHYGAANHQYVFRHDADAAQWHTMAMDWRTGAIRFYRDGALAATLTDASAIPDVAHVLCIQLDAMATRQLTAPVRMFVDYVRIYE